MQRNHYFAYDAKETTMTAVHVNAREQKRHDALRRAGLRPLMDAALAELAALTGTDQ